MFNYIKFGMFLNLGFAGGAEMGGNHEETKFQRESQDPQEAVNSLRSKFEAVKAGEGIVGKREEKLRTSLLKDGDPKDKEFRELAEKVKTLQEELKRLGITRQELGVLLGEIQVEIKKLSPEETDKLKTIDNKEFLSTPFDKRLQYVTTNHVDTSDVSSGQVKELEITFTFDGVYNRELYSKTTAGQILPKEVGEVKVGGETYSRNGLSGEFFTPSNKRLIIEEGTKIEIGNLRTPEQIEKTQTENLNKTQLFLAENPGSDNKIVSEAIARGIDPKFAILAFSGLLEGVSEEQVPQILEDAFTEFDRYRGSYGISTDLKNGKYDDRLAIALFLKFTKNWEESSKAYGITQEKIDEAKSNGEVNMAKESNMIQNDDSLPDGTYLKGDKLLQNEEFSKKLDSVCSNIGASRDDLIKCMKAESGLDSRAVNSQSRATGLIQFMPSTAVDLGTTVGKLRAMTAVEQLDYVQLYFMKNSRGHKLSSLEDLYKVVFFPAALGKSPDWVFDAPDAPARKVASQNSGIAKFSTRSDGLIDGHCFSRYVQNRANRYSV